MDYKEIGKRIRARRIQLGLSQAALAEKLDGARDRISKCETGKRRPEYFMILEMAKL